MTKQIYRIEIPSRNVVGKNFLCWIGEREDGDLQLVTRREEAVPVTHDMHLMIMESMDLPATAYGEGNDCDHSHQEHGICLDCSTENLIPNLNEDRNDR